MAKKKHSANPTKEPSITDPLVTQGVPAQEGSPSPSWLKRFGLEAQSISTSSGVERISPGYQAEVSDDDGMFPRLSKPTRAVPTQSPENQSTRASWSTVAPDLSHLFEPQASSAAAPAASFKGPQIRGVPIDHDTSKPFTPSVAATTHSVYIDDNVPLLVQDTIYIVSKRTLTPSKYFQDILSHRPPGIADPICLENANKPDMDALLKVLETRYLDDAPEMTDQEWIGVIRLANRWCFTKAATFAEIELGIWEKGLMERLEFALRGELEDWLVDALEGLCKQIDTWSIKKVERLISLLGYAGFRALLGARETYLASPSGETWQNKLRTSPALQLSNLRKKD